MKARDRERTVKSLTGPVTFERNQPPTARRARLRAAYRTAGFRLFHAAIRKAHCDTVTNAPRARARRQHLRYSRYGTRDRDRCAAASS